MWRCVLCRAWVVLDDAMLPTPSGRCICLHCWLRETGTNRPLTPALRTEVADIAARA